MRKIKTALIKKAVKKLLIDANFSLPADIIEAVKTACTKENDEMALMILQLILDNARVAKKEKLPLCQDCGNTYIDFQIGPDVCIEAGGNNNKPGFLGSAINETVAEVYEDCYLRTSILSDPLFDRKNTGNNTPALISCRHSEMPGLKISVFLKGGGSENCSWLFMLNPGAGKDIIKSKVIELVKENATKACPPIIIGIGVGEGAAGAVSLAKKAIFRPLDVPNPDMRYRLLEEEILAEANLTGIGPQGLGGRTTALGCNIEFAPCHMATLPVAVFFGCHSTRRASTIL
jgi:fumarate hydratase subunit alpha